MSPLVTRPKNGSTRMSPPKSPAPETTSAIVPVRRVTSERAAVLGV